LNYTRDVRENFTLVQDHPQTDRSGPATKVV